MSRVYAFEDWRLFTTAMEIYRSLGVDLIYAHVKSVLSSVLAFMRLYERSGLLTIRAGLELPMVKINGVPFDPNSETEHTNQLTLAHECFYELRESTQFVALLDWDDLLIGRANPLSLYETFKQADALYPHSAYFSVNKVQTTFNNRRGIRDPLVNSI